MNDVSHVPFERLRGSPVIQKEKEKIKKNFTKKITEVKLPKRKLYGDRPLELPCKAPVKAVLLQEAQTSKPRVRDPRFSDLSGHYNVDLFRKSYSFLEELQQQEREGIKAELCDKSISLEKKEALQRELNRMKSVEYHRKMLSEKQSVKRQFIKAEEKKIIEMAKKGLKPKLPFIPKQSYLKKTLKKNYQQKQSKKSLEKSMIRAEKRLLGKEKKKGLIPSAK